MSDTTITIYELEPATIKVIAVDLQTKVDVMEAELSEARAIFDSTDTEPDCYMDAGMEHQGFEIRRFRAKIRQCYHYINLARLG